MLPVVSLIQPQDPFGLLRPARSRFLQGLAISIGGFGMAFEMAVKIAQSRPVGRTRIPGPRGGLRLAQRGLMVPGLGQDPNLAVDGDFAERAFRGHCAEHGDGGLSLCGRQKLAGDQAGLGIIGRQEGGEAEIHR